MLSAAASPSRGTLAETPEEEANPWLLLEKQFPDSIPVFGDLNSVMWILHLGLGKMLDVEDAAGHKRTLIIAGLLSRSIFQSELILSESNFLELYPDAAASTSFSPIPPTRTKGSRSRSSSRTQASTPKRPPTA
ncbi:MAG: hypothetical protein R2748_06800 [Bryobacterales bacterium]